MTTALKITVSASDVFAAIERLGSQHAALLEDLSDVQSHNSPAHVERLKDLTNEVEGQLGRLGALLTAFEALTMDEVHALVETPAT